VRETTVVGAKRLNLAQATFSDVTGSILVNLWEDQIKLVEPGTVYRLTNVQIHVWAGEKRLSSTKESIFTSIADNNLEDLSISQAEVQSDVIKELTIPQTDLIKKVETVPHCSRCFHKLLQTTASRMARCDQCGFRMRLADCKKQFFANIVVSESGGNSVILTVFQNVLETLITNVVQLNEHELSESLLCVENLKIKYNSKTLVVTEM
jgi:DNA-directed RNA polymerase subunit RPC12/RpoP